MAVTNNPSRGPPTLSELPRDLWTTAYNELPVDNKQGLEHVNSTDGDKLEKIEEVEQLLERAMQAKRENIASQWKLQWGGKEVNVREKAEKIVGWITRFKETVDIAVQYDPVHAALPWAGIRFILTACLSQLPYRFPTFINNIKLIKYYSWLPASNKTGNMLFLRWSGLRA